MKNEITLLEKLASDVSGELLKDLMQRISEVEDQHESRMMASDPSLMADRAVDLRETLALARELVLLATGR